MSKANRRLLGTERVLSQGDEDLGKAGVREQTFLCLLVPQCRSPSFHPSAHRVAFSAWRLTCMQGSREHPQNGKRYHSPAPRPSPAETWDSGAWGTASQAAERDPGLQGSS